MPSTYGFPTPSERKLAQDEAAVAQAVEDTLRQETARKADAAVVDVVTDFMKAFDLDQRYALRREAGEYPTWNVVPISSPPTATRRDAVIRIAISIHGETAFIDMYFGLLGGDAPRYRSALADALARQTGLGAGFVSRTKRPTRQTTDLRLLNRERG